MGFRKIIVAHVLVGLLSVPVQLFAAPPSPPPPPPIEVEGLKNAEEVEEVEPVAEVEETRRSLGSEPPSRLTTGLAQSGAGLVGGLGLGLLGFALGGGGGGVQGADIGGMFLAFVGYGVGSSVSVWAVGESMGWDGSLLATFGGFLASLMFAPLVLVGSTIGYQLSADWPTSQGVTAAPGALALPAAVAMPNITSISIVSFDF